MKIVVFLCCNLLAESIRRQLQDEFQSLTILSCSTPEAVLEADADLLVTDYGTYAHAVSDLALRREVKILIIQTACMPKVKDEHLIGFIGKGVGGILGATSDFSQLCKAIACISTGELWFDRKRMSAILHHLNDFKERDNPSLTKREMEIVGLICRGYRNKDIVLALDISEQAVKSHLNRIYKKLGVCDRLQLALHVTKQHPNCMHET